MRYVALRAAASWVLMAATTLSMAAGESGTAMLYSTGTTWINGSMVPKNSAVFGGDLIQTKAGSLASINSAGSNVVVLSDSVMKYGEKEVTVEHGTVSVVTSKGLTTHAGEISVSPAVSGLTEFRVTEQNGTVQIVAQKGDVTVNDGSQTSTVAQGQETTRDAQPAEKKKRKKRGGAAVPAGSGGALNSKLAVEIGAAAAGGVAVGLLLQNPDPISPSHP